MEIKIYQNRVGVFPTGLLHRKSKCGDGNVLHVLNKRPRLLGLGLGLGLEYIGATNFATANLLILRLYILLNNYNLLEHRPDQSVGYLCRQVKYISMPWLHNRLSSKATRNGNS